MEINLDFDLLDKVLEQAEKKGGGGGNIFLGQKNFPLDFKLLSPLPNTNGLPYFPKITYWINSRPFISPSTFGLPCPINEELEEAKALYKADATKYKDLQKLVEGKNLRRAETFLYIGLHLNFSDEQEMILDVNDPYNGGKVKILELGKQANTETLKLIKKSKGIKPTQFFASDSYIVAYAKSGTGMNTEYSASYWPNRMQFDDLDTLEIPDVVEITRKQLKSESELRNIVRNYLYGEALEVSEDAPKQQFNEPEKSISNPLLEDVLNDAAGDDDLPF